MSGFDDRDVLAAIGTVNMAQPTPAGGDVRVRDAGNLLDVEYDGDIDDHVDRLIQRGLIEGATTRNRNGEPLEEFETPPTVRMTEVGWFYLWRR